MSKEIEKLISQAHTRICRRNGLEYAPTTNEIETEIKNYQMKNQIKQALVDYLSKNGVDGYGQIKTLDPYSVFKDKTDEVLEWDKEHKLLSMRTYGWRYGTYKGFTVSEIKDEDIKQACYKSAQNNEVYRRAMTSW